MNITSTSPIVWTFELPRARIWSAICSRMISARFDVPKPSTTWGDSQASTVTAPVAEMTPRASCSGGHGVFSGSSAMQKASRLGPPMTSWTGCRGLAPPRFQVTRRTARPMARLARAPPPLKTDSRVSMERARTAAPETMTRGQQGWVVHTTPRRLKRGSSMASRAVITAGMCSGRQPAMAALAQTSRTVAQWPRGGISPITWSAPSPLPATSASTTDRSGGKVGSPSVRPRR